MALRLLIGRGALKSHIRLDLVFLNKSCLNVSYSFDTLVELTPSGVVPQLMFCVWTFLGNIQCVAPLRCFHVLLPHGWGVLVVRWLVLPQISRLFCLLIHFTYLDKRALMARCRSSFLRLLVLHGGCHNKPTADSGICCCFNSFLFHVTLVMSVWSTHQ